MNISDQEFEKLLVSGQFEKVIDLAEKQIFDSPKKVSPHWYRFLASNKCKTERELLRLPIDIVNSPDVIITAGYGSPQLKERALRIIEQSMRLNEKIVEITEDTVRELLKNDEIDRFVAEATERLDNELVTLSESCRKLIVSLVVRSYGIRRRDAALSIIRMAFLEQKRAALDIQDDIEKINAIEDGVEVEDFGELKQIYEKCYDLFKAVESKVFQAEETGIDNLTEDIRKQEAKIKETNDNITALCKKLDEKMDEYIKNTAIYESLLENVRKSGSAALLDHWKIDEVNDIMEKALNKLDRESGVKGGGEN